MMIYNIYPNIKQLYHARGGGESPLIGYGGHHKIPTVAPQNLRRLPQHSWRVDVVEETGDVVATNKGCPEVVLLGRCADKGKEFKGWAAAPESTRTLEWFNNRCDRTNLL